MAISTVRQISSWNHDFSQLARESGFHFRQPQLCTSNNGFFDWKEIDCIDVDTIVSNRDCNAIDRLLPHLMEAPIGTLVHNRILDPNIRKYLQLTQLGLQYLLFCKKFLDKTVAGLRSAIDDASKDNSKLGRLLKKKNEEIIALQNRIHDRDRKHESTSYQCFKCTKNFHTYNQVAEHMQQHFENDHETVKKPPVTPVTDNSLINAIKLELEVKQLKERLNLAEKELQDQRHSRDSKAESYERQLTPIPSIHVSTVDRATDTNNCVDVSVQVSNELSPYTEIQTNNKHNSDNKNFSDKKEVESQRQKEELVSITKLHEILNDQTKIFEKQRENERNMYRNELFELKSGFKEAFQGLQIAIDSKVKQQEKEAVTKENTTTREVTVVKEAPTPKKPVQQEKLDVKETSNKTNEKVSPTKNEIPVEKILREEHEHWETRFKKLERIFETNQKMMSSSLQNLSETYSTKLNTLEKSIKNVVLSHIPDTNEVVNKQDSLFNNKKAPKEQYKITDKPVKKPAYSTQESTDISIEKIDEAPIDKSHYITRKLTVDSTERASDTDIDYCSVEKIPDKDFHKKREIVASDSSPKASPDKKRPAVEKKLAQEKLAKNTGAIRKPHRKHSAKTIQKQASSNSNKQPKTKPNLHVPEKSEVKPQHSAEEQFDIFSAFRRRLSKYGMKDAKNGLSTPQMLSIKSQLAQDRLQNKRSNKLFAAIRSKMSSKVDKEAKLRLEKLKALESKPTKKIVVKHWNDMNKSTIDEEDEAEEDEEDNEYNDSFVSSEADSDEGPVRVQYVKTKTDPNERNHQSKNSRANETIEDSSFNITESQFTSTKLEDQLKRVLDSPIRRPSLPTGTLFNKAPMPLEHHPVPNKRVLFMNQPQKTIHDEHENEGIFNRTKTTVSRISLTNISDDSDIN